MTDEEKDKLAARINAVSHLSTAVVLAIVIGFMQYTFIKSEEREHRNLETILEKVQASNEEQTKIMREYMDFMKENRQ